MSEDEWVQFNGEELVVTAGAPDEVKEWLEDNPKRSEHIINWGIALDKAGHDPVDWRIVDYRQLVDYHTAKQDQAVSDGDIETAQHHQELAELFKKIGERYFDQISEEVGDSNESR